MPSTRDLPRSVRIGSMMHRAFHWTDRNGDPLHGPAARAIVAKLLGFVPVRVPRSLLRPGDRTAEHVVVSVASEVRAGQLRDQACQSRHLALLRRIGPKSWSAPFHEYTTGLRTDLADTDMWLVRRDG